MGSPGTIDRKKNTSVTRPRTVGIMSKTRRTKNVITGSSLKDSLLGSRSGGAARHDSNVRHGRKAAGRRQLETFDIGSKAGDVVRVPQGDERKLVSEDSGRLRVKFESLGGIQFDSAKLEQAVHFGVRIMHAVQAIGRHGRRVEDVVEAV